MIEESKNSLPTGISINKGNLKLILDSDDYMFTIIFKKVLEIRAIVNKPDVNISVVNKLANPIISCVNTILKEKAVTSNVNVSKIYSLEKSMELPSKIIGTAQLAKANEIAKENLRPIFVAFEYKKDNRNCSISCYYNKVDDYLEYAAFHNSKLTETMPFDMLQKEYESLNYSIQILNRLNEGAF